MPSKARACSGFLFGEKMVAPTTQWIRDNGSVVETTTGILVDELGNNFVDELGNNLLDSVSTDGEVLAHAWNAISDTTTGWSDVLGGSLPTDQVIRVTEQGDTRTTAQGDTRVTSASQAEALPVNAWSGTQDTATGWANVFDSNIPLSQSTRTTSTGDTRVTAQGDDRVTSASQPNVETITTWTEDEY